MSQSVYIIFQFGCMSTFEATVMFSTDWNADFVIHPDMGFEASPSSAFFEKTRRSGEHEARRLLPSLLNALAKADSSH